MAHNYKNMQIWLKGIDLTDLIFEYTKNLPSTEKFNLVSQMNRASCSIPSNIAEGSCKRTDIHFAEFLTTSIGSCYELATQLVICERRGYGNKTLLENCMKETDELQRMIFKFRERILNNE